VNGVCVEHLKTLGNLCNFFNHMLKITTHSQLYSSHTLDSILLSQQNILRHNGLDCYIYWKKNSALSHYTTRLVVTVKKTRLTVKCCLKKTIHQCWLANASFPCWSKIIYKKLKRCQSQTCDITCNSNYSITLSDWIVNNMNQHSTVYVEIYL
jgi:hypothetical protein